MNLQKVYHRIIFAILLEVLLYQFWVAITKFVKEPTVSNIYFDTFPRKFIPSFTFCPEFKKQVFETYGLLMHKDKVSGKNELNIPMKWWIQPNIGKCLSGYKIIIYVTSFSTHLSSLIRLAFSKCMFVEFK